jgi:hypothetical protein
VSIPAFLPARRSGRPQNNRCALLGRVADGPDAPFSAGLHPNSAPCTAGAPPTRAAAQMELGKPAGLGKSVRRGVASADTGPLRPDARLRESEEPARPRHKMTTPPEESDTPAPPSGVQRKSAKLAATPSVSQQAVKPEAWHRSEVSNVSEAKMAQSKSRGGKRQEAKVSSIRSSLFRKMAGQLGPGGDGPKSSETNDDGDGDDDNDAALESRLARRMKELDGAVLRKE